MSFIIDKTGRKIKKGMLVDVCVTNMMTCIVSEISEAELVLPGEQQAHPYVIVQPMPMQLEVGKNQLGNLVAPSIYIVRDAPPTQPEPRSGKLELVQ